MEIEARHTWELRLQSAEAIVGGCAGQATLVQARTNLIIRLEQGAPDMNFAASLDVARRHRRSARRVEYRACMRGRV